jgi:DNA-binding NarL/FixJ family response regulator
MKTITILLAEDHIIVRDGLHALLAAESDMKIIAEASDGQKAVELAITHRPDVVIMDIAMPTLNGFEATRQIVKRCPSSKVLILSAHSDDAYVQRINALGASGYLIKQTASHILPLAIREVMKGKCFFSPSISMRLQKHRQSLMEKLNIHDTAGLTRYAISEGVIESSVQETTGTVEET